MALGQSLEKVVGFSYLNRVAMTRGWPYVAAWAHRISGVLLVLYVCLHVMTLSALKNPEVFSRKMEMFSSLIPAFADWFLAIPVIFHAMNGGRLLLYEIYGNRKDRTVLQWVLSVSVAYLVLLAIFMFMGNQSASALLFWGYMAASSGFLSYLTIRKLAKSGASKAWKMQRITAAFLLLMIPAHMLYMHLDPAVGRDAQLILARMDSMFIRFVDLLLVCAALYHGAYGLAGVCRDYIASRTMARNCVIGIGVIAAVFAWLGVKLLFTV